MKTHSDPTVTNEKIFYLSWGAVFLSLEHSVNLSCSQVIHKKLNIWEIQTPFQVSSTVFSLHVKTKL